MAGTRGSNGPHRQPHQKLRPASKRRPRDFGRLVLVVALALAFVLTVAGAMAVALWGNDAARAQVKDVLGALLPAETLLLGVAVTWYFAGQ